MEKLHHEIKHRIAIVTVNYGSDGYYEECARYLYRHITEWEEVSFEDYMFIKRGIENSNIENPNIKLILILT